MKRSILFLLPVTAAFLTAHPMGNFSVSHYTRLEVSAKGVEVTYALDLAELPAYTLLREWQLDATSPQADLEVKAAAQAREWARGLEFHAAGKVVDPKFVRSEIKLSEGAGLLSVARITMVFNLPAVRPPLTFEDHNFPERAGWKEIVIRSNGAEIVKASQSDVDRTKALTEYPADPTAAPPQDLRASVDWKVEAPLVSKAVAEKQAPRIVAIPQPTPVAAPATPPPSSTPAASQPQGSLRTFLARLLQMKQIPAGWMVLGLIVAFALGGAHALTPGHGKTIVAAYLVGSRGTMKHAAFLGGMVTFTHTISVFLLGIATLFFASYVNQAKITQALEAVSGLAIVAIGGTMLYKRLRALRAAGAQSHDPHHHDHNHHDHTHDHHHDDHSQDHAHVHALDHSHSHGPAHAHDHAHDQGLAHTHDHSHDQLHVHANDHTHDHMLAHIHDHTHDHGDVHTHVHAHDHRPAHTHDHTHAHGQVHTHDHYHDPGLAQTHDHLHDHGHVHAHVDGHVHTHDHSHDHNDAHGHDHEHRHGPGGHSHVPEGEITLKSLIALGVSGGLVPCPDALILLLLAVSVGHVGAGLILLLAFSLGLACVLMAIGMMVLYAKQWLPDTATSGRHPIFKLVPVLSAVVVVCLGLLMTGVSLGWVRPGLAG